MPKKISGASNAGNIEFFFLKGDQKGGAYVPDMLVSERVIAQSRREMKMNSLTENWLAVELDALDDDMDGWSAGMRASFVSLFSEGEHSPSGLNRKRSDFPEADSSAYGMQA